MATDPELNQVLLSILEMERQQAIHIDRMHRWVIALAETLQGDPQLAAALKQHPFFDLGPAPSLRSIDELLRTIDALIRKLRL